jgi:NAD(P)-dependent dehydrogenase (short-subunit alcohol dehydrogenase family)
LRHRHHRLQSSERLGAPDAANTPTHNDSDLPLTLGGTAALVTGGDGVLGLACARRLAADGAVVTICGTAERRLKESADAYGLRYAVADVTEEEQVDDVLAAAGADGPLRIVIAGARGSSSIGPLSRLNATGWRATLDLTATGTMLTLKYAAREMARAGGGSFVAISSIAATTVHRWFGAYGPANAAVDHMVALAADELGGIGIRVNGIRPGIVESELRDLAGHLGMSQVTLDSWVRRGWADGYLHPEARLIVVRADPAEAERLRALHHMPGGQHNRRPWLKNQAALMSTDQEGTGDNADEPRL